MIAPLFAIASADDAVQALLGADSNSDHLRLYPFGRAPQGVLKPYAVFQTIGGSPENFLSGRPLEDHFSLQVNVYGITAASVIAVSKALSDALETQSYITRWGSEFFNESTKNYEFDFDVEFIASR